MTSFHTVCIFNSFHVRARFEKYPTNDQETDRVKCEIYIRLVNKIDEKVEINRKVGEIYCREIHRCYTTCIICIIYIFDGLFSELGMDSKIDRVGFAEIGEKNQKNQSKTTGEKQNEEKRTETANNVSDKTILILISVDS